VKASEKNRDPERAKKRAVADARCALRKLGLLGRLEQLGEKGEGWRWVNPSASLDFVTSLLAALAGAKEPTFKVRCLECGDTFGTTTCEVTATSGVVCPACEKEVL